VSESIYIQKIHIILVIFTVKEYLTERYKLLDDKRLFYTEPSAVE